LHHVQTRINIDDGQHPKIHRWSSKWKCGFNNLKLTYKGEQAAIQELNRRKGQVDVKLLLDVASLIRGDAEKK